MPLNSQPFSSMMEALSALCLFVFFAAFFVVYILGKMARGMVSRPGGYVQGCIKKKLLDVVCGVFCGVFFCGVFWRYLLYLFLSCGLQKFFILSPTLMVSYVGAVVVFSNVLCLQCFFFGGGRKARRGTVHA